jgi:hypothetical protein
LTAELIPFYRYFAPSPNYHFYTTDPTRIVTTTLNTTGHAGYQYQGVACRVGDAGAIQPPETVPLYRYISLSSDDHFYTTNWQEISLKAPGISAGPWLIEKVAGYVYLSRQANTVPLHRYVHPINNVHLYTTDICEIGTLVQDSTGKGGFKYEGIAAYVIPAYPSERVPGSC